MTPHDEFIAMNDKTINSIIKRWGFPKNNSFFNVKKAQIIKWFNNFTPSELDNALELLKKVQFKTDHEIRGLINSASKELKKIFYNDLTKVLFFPLGLSSASSGSLYLYTIIREILVFSERFIVQGRLSYLDISSQKSGVSSQNSTFLYEKPTDSSLPLHHNIPYFIRTYCLVTACCDG